MKFPILLLSLTFSALVLADENDDNFDESAALPILTDYSFADRNYHVEFKGDLRRVAEATFNRGKVKGSHLNYTDAAGSVYLSCGLNCNNNLSWQLGYAYLDLDWNKNPRFNQKEFHFALTSLAWISTSLEDWRLIVNGGVSVDAETLDFAKSGLYYGMLWGRYHYNDCLGAHIGAFGYIGIRNSYVLPIFGFDWNFRENWTLNLIFPLNFSLEYRLGKYFSLATKYVGFGGPYRSPKRVHGGSGSFHDAIFEVFSSGIELDFNFKYNPRISASIGGGWNTGGWILIKNHKDHHAKYYKFDGAPYAQVSVALGF